MYILIVRCWRIFVDKMKRSPADFDDMSELFVVFVRVLVELFFPIGEYNLKLEKNKNMTVQEFIKRCEREYYDKEPHKKVLKIINGVITVIGVFVVLILLLNINIIPALIVAALVGIYDLLQYYVIDARFHRGVIENYNSYKD